MPRTRIEASHFSSLRSFGLALVLVLGSAGMVVAQSGTPAATPAAAPVAASALEPVPCATRYQVPEPFIDGQNLDCSYLSTPAFPGDAGSPVIRLHVMRLHATGPTPAAEPLIFLTGGPGQAAGALLSGFAPAVDPAIPSLAPMLERQDVILLDQRGTGASEPALTCAFDYVPTLLPPPPVSGATPIAATPIPATPVATPATSAPAPIELPDSQALENLTLGCLGDIQAQGIDLSAFNTENSAADVAALIRALGVPRADLYGVSYGSYLGQRVISRTPELVRGAVLTSIVAPGTDLFLGQIIGFNGVLGDVFNQCSADPDCSAENPDLDTGIETAYNRLTGEPATVDVTDPATGQVYSVVIDGETFLTLTYVLAFGSASFAIPPLITTVASGDDELMAQLGPFLFLPSGISTGTLATVSCQDFVPNGDAGDLDAALADAGVRPVLVQGFTGDARAFYDICAALRLPVAPSLTEPTTSDVPTLLISGELDPITPPEYALEVLPGLSNGQEVTINAIGHDPVSAAGPCGLGLATSFLAAPAEEVDQTCASQIALDFSPDDPAAATPEATPAG